MEALLFTCAEASSIDQTSNKLSLLNIVEEVAGAGFPGVIAGLSLVMLLERKKTEREKITLQIIMSLNGAPFHNAAFDVNFQGKTRTRGVIALQGVPIRGPGIMSFSAKYKGKALGEWPIVIHDIPPVQVAPTPVQAATSIAPNAIDATKDKKKKKRKKK